jgi:Family of unknown function (DUF5681)
MSFEKGNGFGSEYRFKPGESGNPGGRAKSAELSSALRAKLKSDKVQKLPSRTFAEKLSDKLVEEGLDGNVAAIVAIADRTEGKPATSITLGDGDHIKTLCAIMTSKSDELGPPEGFIPHQLESGGASDEQQRTDPDQ